MGKPSGADVTANSNPNSTISHFSHPHPLHLSDPKTLPKIPPCSACKLDAASASVYACINCNFALHPKCSQLPQQLTHPFHPDHALTLHPKPVYAGGLFICDGCGHQGAGFSYHCSPCGTDLHTTCASLPLTLTHHLHHHALALTFSAPYAGNSFSCDICNKLGSGTWIYRCAACGFDVHLTCAAAVVPPPHTIPRSPQTRNYYPPNAGGYNNINQGGMPLPPQAQAYGNANIRLKDRIVVAAVEGVAGALIHGLFGGGGHGDGGSDDGGYSDSDESD